MIWAEVVHNDWRAEEDVALREQGSPLLRPKINGMAVEPSKPSAEPEKHQERGVLESLSIGKNIYIFQLFSTILSTNCVRYCAVYKALQITNIHYDGCSLFILVFWKGPHSPINVHSGFLKVKVHILYDEVSFMFIDM